MATWRATSRMSASFLSSLGTKPSSVTCTGGSYLQRRHYAKKKKPVRNVALSSEETELIGGEGIKKNMTVVMESLKWEYANVITSKLNPSVLGSLELREKGLKIKDVGQIVMPNPQSVMINFSSQPSYIQEAVSLLRAKVNLNPTVEGHVIKASVPRPSKESRDNLSKEAKKSADNAKVRVRRVRQTAISSLRKQKDSISKDAMGKLENHIQTLSDEHIGIIDDLLKHKDTEIQKQ